MQQEPEKESGASVEEVAGQLERQALDEKERDDDDEGKHFVWSLVSRDRKCNIRYSEIISCVCWVPACQCPTFVLDLKRPEQCVGYLELELEAAWCVCGETKPGSSVRA